MDGRPPEHPLPQRVAVHGDAVWQMVDGQVVLLTLSSGRYYRLDEVGSRMWELLDEHPDTHTAFEQLLAEFDVDATTLREDLGALIGKLADAGLLRVEA
jgi:hypothetical protein